MDHPFKTILARDRLIVCDVSFWSPIGDCSCACECEQRADMTGFWIRRSQYMTSRQTTLGKVMVYLIEGGVPGILYMYAIWEQDQFCSFLGMWYVLCNCMLCIQTLLIPKLRLYCKKCACLLLCSDLFYEATATAHL
jgi:hypothetical protein